ncbi:MAG: hypothetical protein HY774_29905 [Acidobacteria bacterium]|nr:hypothetical protein [Acidobacteriota bacterium]
MSQDQPSELPQNLLERLHFVPDPPLKYLPRIVELEALKKMLLSSQTSSIAISGMGGIGKSILAAMIVRESEVLEAFPGGVYWVKFGKRPHIRLLQSELAAALSQNQLTLKAKNQRNLHAGKHLHTRQVLLVLDDVCESTHLGFFKECGIPCQILVTTRSIEVIKSSGIQWLHLDVLDETQALNLLADWADQKTDSLPTEASAIAKLCGNVPLALSLLRSLVKTGLDWADALVSLSNTHSEFSDSEHITSALKVSIDSLPELERADYLKLAVFPEDVPLPEATLITLWSQTSGLTDHQCREQIEKFKQRMLLQATEIGPNQIVELHSLQHLYLKNQCANSQGLHTELVKAYRTICPSGWHTGPNDGYFHEWLPYHLKQAGLEDELRNLLLNYRWMQASLNYLGVSRLMAKYKNSRDPDLELIHQTFQLSSHILHKDPGQLRSQLWGRLADCSSPDIQAVLNQARLTGQNLWLRPAFTCLAPPNGPLLFTLEGHTDEVTSVAVLSHGDRIVSGSKDGTLKIWDLETRMEICTISEHKWWEPVKDALSFILNDIQIEKLKRWTSKIGKPFTHPTSNSDSFQNLAVLHEGKWLASSSPFRPITIWDLETGLKLATVKGVISAFVNSGGQRQVLVFSFNNQTIGNVVTDSELTTFKRYAGLIKAMAAFPDDQQVGIVLDENVIKVVDLKTGTEQITLTGHHEEVISVEILPDRRRLVSASWDKTLKLWDLTTGRELVTFTGHTAEVEVVALLSDNQRMVSGGFDNTLKIWDLKTGSELATCTGHSALVLAVTVIPDRQQIVSTSGDNTLKVWDVAPDVKQASLKGHQDEITALAVFPDGQQIVTGSKDCTLKIWDVTTGAELATFTGHSDHVTAVVILPDGQRVVSASRDHTLKVWDLATGAELTTLAGHLDEVTAVVALPDGQRVVSASKDKTIKVWHLAKETNPTTFTGHSDEVIGMTVLPDGQRLVLTSSAGRIQTWDLVTGLTLASFTGNKKQITAVTVYPDGQRLVLASIDNTLKVLDLKAGGREQATLSGHTMDISTITMRSDGQWLVSASWDGTLKVWDLETQQIQWTYFGDAIITACAIAPDGKTIFAGDVSGRVHFLKLEEASQ